MLYENILQSIVLRLDFCREYKVSCVEVCDVFNIQFMKNLEELNAIFSGIFEVYLVENTNKEAATKYIVCLRVFDYDRIDGCMVYFRSIGINVSWMTRFSDMWN